MARALAAGRGIARWTLRRMPWLRRQLFSSVDYRILTPREARERQAAGWQRPLTALRQERAYTKLLEQMLAGKPRIDLEVAVQAVRATGIEHPSILEVGCGGGYYHAVFGHMLGRPFEYVGVDYSQAMVEAARHRYPQSRFECADACQLPFADRAFDIVFNGVCLMHVLDFERAIVEGRRVARSHCIYHSVPTFRYRSATYLSKYAYGGLVVEIVFNRAELLELFARHGLELVNSWRSIDYNVQAVAHEESLCETFLLRVR